MLWSFVYVLTGCTSIKNSFLLRSPGSKRNTKVEQSNFMLDSKAFVFLRLILTLIDDCGTCHALIVIFIFLFIKVLENGEFSKKNDSETTNPGIR